MRSIRSIRSMRPANPERRVFRMTRPAPTTQEVRSRRSVGGSVGRSVSGSVGRWPPAQSRNPCREPCRTLGQNFPSSTHTQPLSGTLSNAGPKTPIVHPIQTSSHPSPLRRTPSPRPVPRSIEPSSSPCTGSLGELALPRATRAAADKNPRHKMAAARPRGRPASPSAHAACCSRSKRATYLTRSACVSSPGRSSRPPSAPG